MATQFTEEQKTFAISLATVTGNFHEAVRQYKKKFGTPAPDHKQIARWKAKIIQTGCLNRNVKGQGRKVSVCGDENVTNLKTIIRGLPGTSQRKMALQMNISQSSVNRIIQRNSIKKWKPQIKQKLNDCDSIKRKTFCKVILDQIALDPKFHHRIVFSDEANFHVDGHVILHNSIYYGETNPNIVITRQVNSPSIGIFAACGIDGIVSFRIFRGRINSNRSLSILQEDIWPYFRHRHNKLFQLDGAPAHFGIKVRNFLDEKFKMRWIGRGSQFIAYPPRSPDFSICDFFLWGYWRERVYKQPVSIIEDLETIITSELKDIPTKMFRKSYDSFCQRCRICIENDGSYCE